MFFKRFVAVLFAFTMVVSACGPYWTKPVQNGTLGMPGRISVCLDLPSEQLPAAHKAVKLWDDALTQWVHVAALAGGSDNKSVCSIYVHTTTHPDPSDARALAWASFVGGRDISMRVGYYEQDVTGILLHELGHALGAQHQYGALMDPHWAPGKYVCPDKTTVLQVAAWNHVDIDLLKWCYY